MKAFESTAVNYLTLEASLSIDLQRNLTLSNGDSVQVHWMVRTNNLLFRSSRFIVRDGRSTGQVGGKKSGEEECRREAHTEQLVAPGGFFFFRFSAKRHLSAGLMLYFSSRSRLLICVCLCGLSLSLFTSFFVTSRHLTQKLSLNLSSY